MFATGAAIFVFAAGASACLCALARAVAPRLGLVDRPGGRKAHAQPTPLGGGVALGLTLALVAAAGAAVLQFRPTWLPAELLPHVPGLLARGPQFAGVLGLSGLVMLVGLADDFLGLPWPPRLFAQVLAALGLVALGIRATLFPPVSGPWVAGALTVVWVVALTNAFNFLDNMDGLAASVGLIACLVFASAQAAVGGLFVPAVLMALAGGLAGFLLHNLPPARLFLGDAGSNLLGFALGALTVAGTFTRPYDPERPSSPFSVLTPLLVMALPLYDMITVLIIRAREGRSLFQADRRHFSHRLVGRGLTPGRAVATMDFITLVAGLGALLLHHPWLSARDAALIVAQAVCLLVVVAILESTTVPLERPAHGQGPSPTPHTPGDDDPPAP